MAFYEPPYQNCGRCGHPQGVFQCPGCYETFCSRHTEEHREPMRAELEELINRNRNLRGTKVKDDTVEAERRYLQDKIDKWRRDSMEEIDRVARAAQDRINQIFDQYATSGMNVSQKENIENLAARLKQAQQRDDFHETHLAVWKHTLEDFQNELGVRRTGSVRVENSLDPFISRIIVRESPVLGSTQQPPSSGFYFGQPPGPKPPVDTGGKSRPKTYKFRFNTPNVFLGITSGIVDKKSEPWNTPTAYGWAGNDLVYIAGVPKQGYQKYRSDMQPNDSLWLEVDSYRQLIRMTNKSTNQTYELKIAEGTCPLPWTVNFLSLDLVGE